MSFLCGFVWCAVPLVSRTCEYSKLCCFQSLSSAPRVAASDRSSHKRIKHSCVTLDGSIQLPLWESLELSSLVLENVESHVVVEVQCWTFAWKVGPLERLIDLEQILHDHEVNFWGQKPLKGEGCLHQYLAYFDQHTTPLLSGTEPLASPLTKAPPSIILLAGFCDSVGFFLRKFHK